MELGDLYRIIAATVQMAHETGWFRSKPMMAHLRGMLTSWRRGGPSGRLFCVPGGNPGGRGKA